MKEKSQPALIRSIFCWLQLPAAPAFLLGGNRAKAAPPEGLEERQAPRFASRAMRGWDRLVVLKRSLTLKAQLELSPASSCRSCCASSPMLPVCCTERERGGPAVRNTWCELAVPTSFHSSTWASQRYHKQKYKSSLSSRQVCRCVKLRGEYTPLTDGTKDYKHKIYYLGVSP